jgi:hypothetical protein
MEHRRTLGLTAFAVGVLSLALLGASIAWAHHWNAPALVLVSGWSVSTLVALVLSSLGLRGPRGAKGFAAYGLLFGILSVVALALAGVAYAAGMDPGAACGGG